MFVSITHSRLGPTLLLSILILTLAGCGPELVEPTLTTDTIANATIPAKPVTSTAIAASTPTNTLPPTHTPTATSSPPSSPTNTPTATPQPTDTSVPPMATAALPTKTPLPPTASPVPQTACVGDTSAQLTQQAWGALGSGDLAKALACTEETIQRWTAQADEQQAMREQQGICFETPDPNNKEQFDAYWGSFWAVNDVATNWFIRGEALRQQGEAAQAPEAYQTVIDRYSCAYAFDPDGPWFWRVAEAAQGKLN